MKGKGIYLLFCVGSLMAADQVDQSYLGPPTTGHIVENTQWLGQSFRPSFTGLLTGIDLQMSQDAGRSGLFNVSVRPLANPGDFSTPASFGDAVFSKDIPFTAAGVLMTTVHVPVENRPTLAADQPYIILLTTSVQPPGGGADPIAWYFGPGPYARGSAFMNFSNRPPPTTQGWFSVQAGGDYLFQTYMLQIPEPTTYGLCLSALAAFAAGFYRRRKH